MVHTEVDTHDARPVCRDRERSYLDCLFGNREDAPAAQNRNALCPCFAFVLRVCGDDGFALLFRVVLGIVDRHVGDGRACGLVD